MASNDETGRAALTPLAADIAWSDGADASIGRFEGVAVEVRPEPGSGGEWAVRLDGEIVGAAATREAAKSLAAERAASDRLRRTLGAQIG